MSFFSALALAAAPSTLSTLELPAGPDDAPIVALVVSGANNHWWQWTTPSLAGMLEASGKFEVRVTEDPATTLAGEAAIADVDVFVLDYNGPRWGDAAEANFVAAVEKGAGVSVIHAADNAFPGWSEYETMVGLLWREGAGHGAFHRFDVEITDRDHPITRDLPRMVQHPDELYHHLTPTPGSRQRVLMQAFSDSAAGGIDAWQPMALVQRFGAGRVFHTPLGHVWVESVDQQASHTDPQFQELVVRGTEWAATGAVTPPVRPANVLTANEVSAGWELLFDGRTLDGWQEYQKDAAPDHGWDVEDGTLHVSAGAETGDLVTARDYQDFELAFEYRVSEGANSGVMYRVSPEGGTTYLTGPEYQVLDDAHSTSGTEPLHAAGALYALYPAVAKPPLATLGWNTGRIVVVGNRVEHWLNGARVVTATIGDAEWSERLARSKFADAAGFGTQRTGRIALQNHGDEVWYRNLRVRDLSPRPEKAVPLFAEAPSFAEATASGGFSGWTHWLDEEAAFSDVWTPEPGGFVCSGAPRGYLLTEGSHANFVLRLAWRWNPGTEGGNSGVLLRMQPPNKIWPRCFEAQLKSGSAGDFWRMDGFPLEAAAELTNGGHTTGRRGAERPLGEWNQYEILVDRGDVVLRINGEIVNQGWNAAELAGPIGLQSEGAEIHVRDVTLQELP